MSSPVTKRRPAKVVRPYGGVDAEIRRQDRRTRIVAAGLEVIGIKGYPATTVRDICTESGLSERYFYESFKGLAPLFDALYAACHTESQNRVTAAFLKSQACGGDAMAMSEAAITAWLSYLKEDVRRARILLVDAVTASDSSLSNAKAALADYTTFIRAFVELLYPRIAELHYRPSMIASMLSGASIHAAKDWMWSGFEQPLEDVARHLTWLFRSLHDHYVSQFPTSGTRSSS